MPPIQGSCSSLHSPVCNQEPSPVSQSHRAVRFPMLLADVQIEHKAIPLSPKREGERVNRQTKTDNETETGIQTDSFLQHRH